MTVLTFTLKQAMMAKKGSRFVGLLLFNTSARWGGWSFSRLNRFYPIKRAGTYSVGEWVDP
jgi:hypothetical protein